MREVSLDICGRKPAYAADGFLGIVVAPEPLLIEIDRFLARTGMAESAFGRASVNDWKLVRSLRGDKPRRLWPETEQKIRQFMAAHSAGQTSVAA